ASGSGLASGLLRLRVLEAISPPAQVINSAVLATKVSPRPSRDLVVGFASGLFFGLILMAAREALDDRVRVPAQVEEAFGTAVVDLRPGRRRAGVDLREVVAALDEARAPRGASVVAVLSPLPGDGRSMFAGELASALAARGERVVVVDLAEPVGIAAEDLPLVRALGGATGEVDPAPLSGSEEAAVLEWARDWAEEVSVGAPRRGGLEPASTPFYDALLALPPEQPRLERGLETSSLEDVELVPTAAGVPVLAARPGRRITAVRQVLGALAGRYDWVIVDSPPMHSGVRAALVAASCPLALPLVRLGVTSRVQLAAFVEQVAEHAAPPGVVAVCAHR
ncbi:MAG: hypothetical protein ACYDAQ_20005, partial [Mycobacteriales bacterium]